MPHSLDWTRTPGSCSVVKTFNCRGAGRSNPDDKFLSGLGAEMVLRALYGESYMSQSNLTTGFSNVTDWFDLFAEATTSRFRSDYGSADEGARREGDLPLDEIQGLAWQMTTCVSMRGAWLALPTTLTVVTVVLAMWTIATSWRHRRSRPVWKESVLPLMFYGREIVDSALDKYSGESSGHTSQDQDANQTKEKNPLETRDLNKVGESTAVTIPWLHSTDSSGETSALTKRTKWSWRHRKQRKDTKDDPIFDTEQSARKHPENHGDQAAPGNAEPRQDNQALEEARNDTDEQVCDEQGAHGNLRSCEELRPPQISPISALTYTYERVEASRDASTYNIGDPEGDTWLGEDERRPGNTDNDLAHMDR